LRVIARKKIDPDTSVRRENELTDQTARATAKQTAFNAVPSPAEKSFEDRR